MIQRYAQFWFFRKWSGNSFFSIFWVWFFRKMFLVLYFINWPSFIVWLPLVLEMLDNMSIWIVCFPGCDVIDFEINLIFQIKPFSYITKTSKQKVKYLENKKRNKSIFCHFYRTFNCQKLSQTWECTYKLRLKKSFKKNWLFTKS